MPICWAVAKDAGAGLPRIVLRAACQGVVTRAVGVFAALVVCWPRPATAQRDGASQLAVAESALVRGDIQRAVDLARDYTAHHPTDWRGWFMQGEATLRSGGSSNLYRVGAIIAFRRATKLAPERAEVWDGYGRAGLELGNADGELILHEAYEKVIALDPSYPGAWDNWRKAYRNHDDRQRMRRILARHDSIPEVRARIAQLLIEDEQYPAANRLLDSLLEEDPRQPEWLALRGQSALEAGDTLIGSFFYGRALVDAGRAGGELLWQQAVGVATPAEIRAWEAGIPDTLRSGFLRSFWARRNPDLFAGVNQRLAEHFARLRVARKAFQATHPLASYKNRELTRALSARATVGEQIFYQKCEAGQDALSATQPSDFLRRTAEMESLLVDPSVWDRRAHGIQAPGELNLGAIAMLDVPYGRDLRDIDTTAAALGYNLRTGLDDRGLTYLRFGAPRKRVVGAPNNVDQFCQVPDLERWVYDDIGVVRFFRPEAISVGASAGWGTTGEQVFRPMNEPQFRAMEQAMTRNATSVPAPLSFGVWTAQFAGAAFGTTEIVVVATRGAVAAQLDGTVGEAGPPEQDGGGVVTLHAPPGSYTLLANAKVADSLGRQGLQLLVRRLGAEAGVSDLLLAPAWPDTSVTRRAMVARLQRDLTFPPGSPLRVYAEVYGLQPADDGSVVYRASYQLFRTDDPAGDARRDSLPGGVRLSFERRKTLAGDRMAEWLDVTPARIPTGRYLLRLEIRTPGGDQIVGRSQIGFQIVSE